MIINLLVLVLVKRSIVEYLYTGLVEDILGVLGLLKSIYMVLAKDLVIGKGDIWAKSHLLGILGFRL